ncbi:50S ribosomal protein L11 methyltransferase [Streptomyces zagrosensis]|uniref:Protein arginine N-methyltransferase 1 n=1 Tax=Streptomyces zagrosensis TaxID=1042984 RepID=A0A7W9V2C5_9ACTN|nr:50S ribosomal protein L11 methyltransferase [Streptomyces zagrosensis]MBB5939797.1 protein arginine N-methyltransferase 1 [Streptomyces zagrosensis]
MARSLVAEIDTPGGRVPVRACVYEPIPPLWLFPSIGEYPLYDDFAYGQMLKDELRMERYAAAVRRYAPGRTVLDIGTGQDAVWALAAARAGAQHVWAVEVIPKSARIARENIEQAGFSDRITVIEGLSTDIELPEPVDLCVSEIIGTLGGSEGAGAVLRDARQRLVKPGGLFIPHRSATTAVAFDIGRASAGAPPGFPLFTLRYLEEVFAGTGHPFDLRVCLVGPQDNPAMRKESYLSTTTEVEPLEFNGDLRPEGVDRAEVAFTRAGRFHGLALGMRLWVAEDDEPLDSLVQASSWTPVWAPLSEVGLPVRPGDRFEFTFTTTMSDDGVHPDYALAGTLRRDIGPAVPLRWRSAHHQDSFRASPFYRSLFPEA